MTVAPAGVEASGTILVVLDGEPLEVTYRLAYDARWQFLRGTVLAVGAEGERTLWIERGPRGDWFVDGSPRPDLSDCDDIDVMTTPFTDTPPLRRFDLDNGGARSLHVAWVRLPDLTVAPVEQEYQRIDAPGAARYRYRNLESGFSGELAVDADAVVLEYGPWARLDP